tara:strand:- start:1700 stop:2068 length:369 start_codon:yes stop_codon:yes gene_type:complete
MRKKWEIGRGQPERGGMQGLIDRIGGAGGYGGPRSRLKIKKKKEQEVDESPRDPKVTERFLEDHGYTPATSSSKQPNTYEKLTDGGKYRIYTGTRTSSGKTGVSQNTMKNPSLKELMIWMGY